MSRPFAKSLLLIFLLLPGWAIGEITPSPGQDDARVRVVDYNPMNVVKLVTFFGVSSHVQFAENETILDVAIGDDLAWNIKPRGNHLFIKPKAANADTNVTVITNKRTYQFALVVTSRSTKDTSAWADPKLIFSLIFRYPLDELRAAEADVKIENAKSKVLEIKKNLLAASKAATNFDYWVAGSEEISPSEASDDGLFIFLKFDQSIDMAAVFSVDSEGNESIINTNVIDSNIIVVQRRVEKLILRKGSYVASIINRSFYKNGAIDNFSGTVSPNVERVIRELK